MRARMLQEPSTPAYLSGAPCPRVRAYCSEYTIDPPPVSYCGLEHARVLARRIRLHNTRPVVPLPTDPSLELGQSVATAVI
jgi:hypothetical protein